MAAESTIAVNDEEYELLVLMIEHLPEAPIPERLRGARRSLRKKVERA